jgi:hypothetical protein
MSEFLIPIFRVEDIYNRPEAETTHTFSTMLAWCTYSYVEGKV